MRVAFLVSPGARHQILCAQWLSVAAKLHGDTPEIYHTPHEYPRKMPDAFVCWGWRKGRGLRNKTGVDVLVMERAYLGDRYEWVSLAWNGLNNRGTFAYSNDDGERWRRHFAPMMAPWRERREGYALLLGQVPSDMACVSPHGVWLARTAKRLTDAGHPVLFRAHPQSRGMVVSNTVPCRAGSLAEALEGASHAVTFNSNSGVDAVMAGVPTVTCDPGAMAWDVTGHDPSEVPPTPDRESWGHRLAWRQWLPNELADGSAYLHIKAAKPHKGCNDEENEGTGAGSRASGHDHRGAEEPRSGDEVQRGEIDSRTHDSGAAETRARAPAET